VQKGILVTPRMGRKTLAAGLKAVVADLAMNGKATDHVQRQIDLHLVKQLATGTTPERGYFHADKLMSTVTTDNLTAYVVWRQAQGASAASCNHELATVRRAFRLALRGRELATMPYIPMLKLDNARKGFLERPQLDAILAHLPDYLRGPLEFLYATGWRKSEVLTLKASQVDLASRVVRPEPGETKNREARAIAMTTDVHAILAAHLDSIEVLKERGVICPFVFHRPDGSAIKDFRASWDAARTAAGYPAALVHDFRRSAVRNLERAGVPRSTSMQITGHKTESVFRRYAIVDEAMHREAAAKLDAWAEDQQAKAKAERKGQVKRFAKRQRVSLCDSSM
jgi:integrase